VSPCVLRFSFMPYLVSVISMFWVCSMDVVTK